MGDVTETEARSENFRAWVTQQRLSLGLTQAGAARLAGRDRSTWVAIEKTGRNQHGGDLRPETLIGVATALGVTPEEVFARAGAEMPEAWAVSTGPEGDKFLEAYEKVMAEVMPQFSALVDEVRRLREDVARLTPPQPSDSSDGAPPKRRGSRKPPS